MQIKSKQKEKIIKIGKEINKTEKKIGDEWSPKLLHLEE